MGFNHGKTKTNKDSDNVQSGSAAAKATGLKTSLETCGDVNITDETISCFIDGELPEMEYAMVQKHLDTCRECQKVFQAYHAFESHFHSGVTSQLSPMEMADSKNLIMDRIALEGSYSDASPSMAADLTRKRFRQLLKSTGRRIGHGIKNLFSVQPLNRRKFYLQLTSVAAIIICSISLVYLQKEPSLSGGPSAIVTSVDGEVSSVMILETREHQHTIIWYKEA